MSPDAQRLSLAELEGFVWYRRRCAIVPEWGGVQFCLPPEKGIAHPAWKGTVSETRHCTPEEIAEAKRTGVFYTYASDYLSDLDAIYALENRLLGGPTSHPTDADALCYRYAHVLYSVTTPENQQPFRATAAQRGEALLRLMERWDDSL